MNAAAKNLFWPLAVGMMLLNLLNLVLWAMGGYVHPLVYVALIAVLLMVSHRPTSNTTSVILLVVVFCLVVLSGPVVDWDARSIWFFHAKRIFFDNNLYAQLDGYAAWSHNDYPILVPAVAASLAKSVGHWNEIFPRLSVVLVLLPAVLVLAWAFVSRAAFNLLAVAVLLMGNKLLLNGYMDALLAIYCACACVLLSAMWAQQPGTSTQTNRPNETWLFVLVVSNIIFLKNEGLLAALLLWACAIPALWRSWKWLAWSLAPFVLYAVLWRLPLQLNHIQGDLFGAGILERAVDRLQDPTDIQTILVAVLKHVGLYGVVLLAASVWSFKHTQLKRMVPVAAFVVLYTAAIVAVYVITPNELAWHLATSANRTFMIPNMCVVASVLYLAMRRV